MAQKEETASGNDPEIINGKDQQENDGKAPEDDGKPVELTLSKCPSKPFQKVEDGADGGWGWVVLSGSFVVLCTNFGIQDSYGIFYPLMQERFDIPLSTVSWIGSIGTGFGCFSALIMPSVIDRFGCFLTGLVAVMFISGSFFISMFVNNVYILYLSLGALPGIGEALHFLVFMKVLSHCFHRRRPLAMGLAYSGGGAGTVIFPPLITFLLGNYGLWGTLLLEGGIILNQLWCDLTFRRMDLKDTGTTQDEKHDPLGWRDYLRLLRSKEMVLALLCFMCQALVYSYFSQFTPTTAVRQIDGLSLEKASLILSVYGVVSTCGRALIGVFLIYLKHSSLRVYILCMCGCGVTVATIPLCTSYPALMAVGAVYAFFIGSAVAIQPTMLVELFGLRAFTHAYGISLVASGFASIVGVPFAGFLAELTSNDSTIYYTAVVGFTMSGLFLVPLSFSGCHFHNTETEVSFQEKHEDVKEGFRNACLDTGNSCVSRSTDTFRERNPVTPPTANSLSIISDHLSNNIDRLYTSEVLTNSPDSLKESVLQENQSIYNGTKL